MILSRFRASVILGVLVLVLLGGCAFTPYHHGSLTESKIEQRAIRQESGALVVRASVPDQEETRQIFGAPLYKSGIQPVWLEITNNSPDRARFIVSSVDREYYSPLEVAYLYRKHFSKQGWQDMERFLYRNAMPRQIPGGETASGFVFTHLDPGTKSFNTIVFYTAEKGDFEFFTFFVPVPGFQPDHADVDFWALYKPEQVQSVKTDNLREALEKLPCCTTNRAGTGQGQPISVALVAPGESVLRALLRAGWSETSYIRDDEYLSAANYLLGRPPDAIFRKKRGSTTERLELLVWLAPIVVDGEPVWLAQTRHALGRRFEITEWALGSRMDPDVDDGRNYLLQDLWYAQTLKMFGFTTTGLAVPEASPRLDFAGNPFFSDGLRIVLWVSGKAIALPDVRPVGWAIPGGLGD